MGLPEFDASVFKGTKKLIIVVGNNSLFTSGVPGVYIIFYVTALALIALLVLFASFWTKLKVMERRYLKYQKRQKGQSSDVRLKTSSQNG